MNKLVLALTVVLLSAQTHAKSNVSMTDSSATASKYEKNLSPEAVDAVNLINNDMLRSYIEHIEAAARSELRVNEITTSESIDINANVPTNLTTYTFTGFFSKSPKIPVVLVVEIRTTDTGVSYEIFLKNLKDLNLFQENK